LRAPLLALRKLQYEAFGLAETTVQLLANGKTELEVFDVEAPERTQAELVWLTQRKMELLFP